MSVNKVILIGNLGSDPEVRTLGNGQTVCNVNVATSESWNDKDGQKQERTEWHRVVLWGQPANFLGQFGRKGSKVYVEGRLETRSWEDQQGQKRYTTEVIAIKCELLSKETVEQNQSFDMGAEPSFDSNEEIPF